ncbi:DNA helicase, partial [Klebsiella pneumoniae]|nr:DNA helicase [Klebsiella pneumoniae]
LHPDDIETLQKKLYPAVERRWLESIDPNHQAGIGHDIYLKLWALSEPNIPADYVLFDEAQDADPLMLGILLKQRSTQVIYVGD